MQTAGLQTNYLVANLHLAGHDHFFLINNANRKASNIVVIRLINSWHFGRFTTDKCHVGLQATFYHAFNNLSHLLGHKFAGGDVIQEEERFCTLAEDVVGAHCYRINTDGVVFVHAKSDIELGAYAIGAGD